MQPCLSATMFHCAPRRARTRRLTRRSCGKQVAATIWSFSGSAGVPGRYYSSAIPRPRCLSDRLHRISSSRANIGPVGPANRFCVATTLRTECPLWVASSTAVRTPSPQLGTFFCRALTHYSNSRNSRLVPGRCATHLSTCGCARRQDHVCANRLTDPCFPQPYSTRRFIFLNSLANASPIKEPNVRSTVVSETAAVLLRFL